MKPNTQNNSSNSNNPENPTLSLSHKEFIMLGIALVDLFMIYPEYKLLVPDLSEKVVNTLNKVTEINKQKKKTPQESQELQNNDAGDSNVIITVAV